MLRMFIMAQEGLGSGSAPAPEGAAEGAAEAGKQAADPCAGGGSTGMIIWMVLLFALMYFMLIRPQKKQRETHQKLIESLKKGDRVVTSGGMLGTIAGITENTVIIEVSDGVKVKVQKSHVAGLQTDPNAAKNE
jgi:preprotein translocase subunit YajC